MKHLSVRSGLFILLACVAVSWCSSPAAAQDTAATYKTKCLMCHGADGKGTPTGIKMGAHDFASADVQKESDAQLTDVISKGKGKMPPYAGKLKDSEIKDLVAYIRGLAKK